MDAVNGSIIKGDCLCSILKKWTQKFICKPHSSSATIWNLVFALNLDNPRGVVDMNRDMANKGRGGGVGAKVELNKVVFSETGRVLVLGWRLRLCQQ